MPEDDNAPGASNVGIFVRVRPVQRASKNVAVSPEDGKLHFHIPRDEADGCAAALRLHVAPLQTCCVPANTVANSCLSHSEFQTPRGAPARTNIMV